jgi:tetratricopeptide (TPR) repeat protein
MTDIRELHYFVRMFSARQKNKKEIQMPTSIVIREQKKNDKSFAATVRLGSEGAQHEITITNSFSEEQEKRLEWYFEEWLNFPFTDKVKAKEAEADILAYGENLFNQVFGTGSVIRDYDKVRENKPDFHLQIIGSPEFHALHWEAMKDPDQNRPLSVDKPIVRKNKEPVTYKAEVKAAPLLRVLLISARPGGAKDVSYRTISRPLVEALETAKIAARIDIVRPGTYEALVKHLENIYDEHGNGYYHIVHLDLHGALLTYEQYKKESQNHNFGNIIFKGGYAQKPVENYEGLKGFLFFNDPNTQKAVQKAVQKPIKKTDKENTANPVSAEDLTGLFNMRQIPIIILNACQSGKQIGAAETSLGSQMLKAGAGLVVAMGYSVTVSAAKILMTSLYSEILDGRAPDLAIRRARLELYNDRRRKAAYGQEIELEDWLLPVIYQNRTPKLDSSGFKAYVQSEIAHYSAPRTTYRFVGRDLEILEIENSLLNRRNILLIQGMGGAGKTTLLQHLGWWWQKTRFVTQIYYFGYDLKAWNVQQIITAIGEALELKLSGILKNDRAMVLHALKSTRHLLVLDNMESITGAPLAVQNTLNSEAQAELKTFLQELWGGKSLILLGSRSSEEWLWPDPLRENDIYELQGLDYQAQTELVQEIITNVNAPHYPEIEEHRADFQRLLKLLGGFPLAMEVVLANLAQNTPAEIIERLQAADIKLDNKKERASKTESILRCVDYSHSNLSEQAQKLLLCLAPFTGVINIDWLKHYTEELKKQPELQKLPFNQWQSVLQEAVNWGLLKPHENQGLAQMGYLTLQPIFPYFLKTRLNASDDPVLTAYKQAIEMAFYEHYNGIGGDLVRLIESKEAQEKQMGQILIGVEYENLMTALLYTLFRQAVFFNSFEALFRFFDQSQQFEQAKELCELVISAYDKYPQEKLIQEHLDVKFYLVRERLATTLFNLKNYQEAHKAYEDALTAIDGLSEDYQKSKGTVLHQLGYIAYEQRQWESAESYYKEALKVYIEFNDRYEQAGTLHQLGMLAQNQHQWEAAKESYKEALKIFIEFNDRYTQAQTLHNLGVVAHEQRQWESAESYYKEALKIKIEFNDRYSQASTLYHLGAVAHEQRQWESAESYYKESLKIKIEFNDRYFQASTLGQLARLAHDQQNWEQAAQYELEAAEIFVQYSDQHRLGIALHGLARTWQQSRDDRIPVKIGELLEISREEPEALLEKLLEKPSENEEANDNHSS